MSPLDSRVIPEEPISTVVAKGGMESVEHRSKSRPFTSEQSSAWHPYLLAIDKTVQKRRRLSQEHWEVHLTTTRATVSGVTTQDQ